MEVKRSEGIWYVRRFSTSLFASMLGALACQVMIKQRSKIIYILYAHVVKCSDGCAELRKVGIRLRCNVSIGSR